MRGWFIRYKYRTENGFQVHYCVPYSRIKLVSVDGFYIAEFVNVNKYTKSIEYLLWGTIVNNLRKKLKGIILVISLNEGLIGIIDELKNIQVPPFKYCPWCGKNITELKLG